MNIGKAIHFSSKEENFSINTKDCLKIFPISSVGVIKNPLLSSKINHLQYFMFMHKELIPVFELPRYFDIDDDMKNTYILVVLSDNKKVGLKINIDTISIHDTDTNQAQNNLVDMNDLLIDVGYSV